MSDEWRSNVLRAGFLLSLIFWGLNVAFKKVEYIPPDAPLGLFQVIPLVFIIPLSFTVLYAADCIKREKKMAYMLFIVFFFVLWSTPYLMEEQVRDWDAYWHGFASFRMTEGLFNHGNGIFSYAAEFPGGFMFFAMIADVIGTDNFLYFLKFIPLLAIAVTSLGIVLFFRMLEEHMPERKNHLRYAMFLSALVNPFFAFHLSPEAYGTMLIFILMAVMAMIMKTGGRKDRRLYLVLGLLLAGLVIAHPTTLIFALLLMFAIPICHMFYNRKNIEKKMLALYLAIPLILMFSGILSLLLIPKYMDSVLLNTMRRLMIGFFGSLTNLEVLSRYTTGFTVATTFPSLVQKIFFGVALLMVVYLLLMKEKQTILAGLSLASLAYLLILVGLSGGFFLERAFIFLAIPISYAMLTFDWKCVRHRFRWKKHTLDKRAVIAVIIVFVLFLPTFYWRECSQMFTDEETDAIKISWSALEPDEIIKLSEEAFPLFFLIGEENTNQYYDLESNRYGTVLEYDKGSWADFNLGYELPPEVYGTVKMNRSIIFSSEHITVYYLK